MKRVTVANYLKLIQGDLKEIERATDYTSEYLKHDTACDSSHRSTKRMEVVLEAEREFVQQNKKKILALAAQKLKDEIEELKQCLK